MVSPVIIPSQIAAPSRVSEGGGDEDGLSLGTPKKWALREDGFFLPLSQSSNSHRERGLYEGDIK